MWFSTGCGRIELNITKWQAENASHPGPCDRDIKELSEVPKIKRQLDKLDPKLLAEVLSEYGAWDELDLSEHQQNLQRVLWIACGDIVENLAK